MRNRKVAICQFSVYVEQTFSPFLWRLFLRNKLHLADNGEGLVGSQSRACIG